LGVSNVVVPAQPFSLLPGRLAGAVNLDDKNWLQNIFTLVLGMTGRSALKKMETAPSAPKS